MGYVGGLSWRLINQVFFINNKDCGIPVAILAGISLVFEPKGRQAEIALFCLNKSI